ncbi:hypothetical protein AC579_6980 [Pseudocercospora musae]|uniref:Uncharacterized protein n=1 Tax=Pseudocercospora musae TaxID=113226 RepID=A0A139IAC6_9PEZI|nr:hypothetical protein AC579_6980 [Pseudocercospora musae]
MDEEEEGGRVRSTSTSTPSLSIPSRKPQHSSLCIIIKKMSSNKLRLYATTASVAAITAAGAWYGAGINIRQEHKQQETTTLQQQQQQPAAERISQLQVSKKKLIQQREELQKKIEILLENKKDPPIRENLDIEEKKKKEQD